jgi:transcriptional regulator with GAF, ATPase, and Fis domain
MKTELLRQQAFGDLVAKILARFASSTAADIDKHIAESLGEIACFIGIEYAYLAHIAADDSSWSVTHEWCSPGSPSLIAQYQNVPMGTFNWSEQTIIAGKTIVLNSLAEVPEEFPDDRARLEATGFKSNLQLPLFGEQGRVNGCIALSTLQHEVAWNSTGIQQLRLVGDAIAGVLCRKQAETELRQALEEVDRLTVLLRAENLYLQEEIASTLGFDDIVGESAPIRLTLAKIEHVAVTDASVLLLGETGTGKELLARAIHNRSPRKDRPMVKVNLAALPASLIESELFGHVKGAYTGAVADKIGRFELADGGTLFLDEIGELNSDLQTKLLRVLQEGEFERIGSSKTVRVDVRVVAATNRDLHQAMEQEKFRPDLYYRLAVFPIEIPPLRLRRDDIPLLVWHLISKKQKRLGKTITIVPKSTMNFLVNYDWPGNIRELENVVERAMILTSGSTLMLEGFVQSTPMKKSANPVASPPEVTRSEILNVLEACQWKIKGSGHAAERLGLKPSTLRYRMKVLGIKRPG